MTEQYDWAVVILAIIVLCLALAECTPAQHMDEEAIEAHQRASR